MSNMFSELPGFSNLSSLYSWLQLFQPHVLSPESVYIFIPTNINYDRRLRLQSVLCEWFGGGVIK